MQNHIKTIRSYLTIILFLFPALRAYGNSSSVDSLLKVLDRIVEAREDHSAERKKHIEQMERQITPYTPEDVLFETCHRLFDEYKNFQLDSALRIAERIYALSLQMNNEEQRVLAELSKAEVLVMTGMYKEAMDMLSKIETQRSSPRIKTYLNHLYHSLYMLLADYSFTEENGHYYKEKEIQYKDSILAMLPPGDFGYKAVYSSKLVAEGRCQEAVEASLALFREYSEGNHDIGLTAYLLSQAYHCMGDREMEKQYLILSSIGDLRAGVREYISLRKLAALLYKEGDVKRAYNYSKCAMEDAMACHARLRTLETSQMLPIINAAYDQQTKKEKRNLYAFIIIISTLTCVLVAALIYIDRQLRNLAKHRRLLNKTNAFLKQANEELDKANTELREANLVKKEYISSLFNMCSTYISKLDDFRIAVNRKLKVKQYDDLMKFTDSSSLVSDELKEFYKNFDTIFLNLYPGFVEDFNSLLQDDAHVEPKEGELLSPELRIYALVRLGISDSVKIAGFLHYSPQTVYNYRLRIRNKAKVSKDSFPEAVRRLGKIQD